MIRSLFGLGVFHSRALIIPRKAFTVRPINTAPLVLKARSILQPPQSIGRTDHSLRTVFANLWSVLHWHSSLPVQALCLALTVCASNAAELWRRSHIFVRPIALAHSNSPSPYTFVELSKALASALSLAFSSRLYPRAFLPASLGSIL